MTCIIPKPLIEDISQQKASLFLGAGASCEAGAFGFNDLISYLLDRAGEPYCTKLKEQDLSVIADYLYEESGFGKYWVRKEIINYIKSQQKALKNPPSPAHEAMTSIGWRSIFTTNYDTLVEMSYSNPKRVQDFLPIYNPDEQIKRHEKDTIRLIKLNGSIDEADRNSNHELIVTFSDQLQAKIQNRKFYELLRDEAIYGPIIFVGFRFRHPGAYSTGTSPEFQILKEILQEMRSASRWHYCIVPYDPNSLDSELAVKVLKANQIQVINCTFGQFMDEIKEKLSNPVLPLADRPPIDIIIGQSSISISADDYAKDRNHFEIIGSHLRQEEEISAAESLNGNDVWESFFRNHYINRSCEKDFLNKLEECTNEAPGLLSFISSAGWGKTFFLKYIAVELHERDGRPVIWLNPFATLDIGDGEGFSITAGKWDERRIDYIIESINHHVDEIGLKNAVGIPIIIADNCSERIEECLSLFRHLKNKNRNFIMIISLRDNEFKILSKGHSLVNKGLQFCPEDEKYDSGLEIHELLNFCQKYKIGLIENESQREIIARRIIDSEADGALILALQIIFDERHRPFSEIIKDLWNSIDTDIGKKMVLRVASLHRFGSIYCPRLSTLVSSIEGSNILDSLEIYDNDLKNRILFEENIEEEQSVRTMHSLVSKEIAKVSGKADAEIDDELISLVAKTTDNERDLEIVRRLLKQINYFELNLSSEDKTDILFKTLIKSTNADWVVCHQYSNFLLNRGNYDAAINWIERAIKKNPKSATLKHTKGNIYYRQGMDLKLCGSEYEAEKKFDDARKFFALSRVGADPSEHGYVTHLDMLLKLIDSSGDECHKADLYSEGIHIYKEGFRSVSKDRFNLLTEKKFNRFRSDRGMIEYLVDKIETGLSRNKASVYAISFLADHYYSKDDYERSLEILELGRKINREGIILWVKEAELDIREGCFNAAAKCIDSAKRREAYAENIESVWRLRYWDLICSFIMHDYYNARRCLIDLRDNSFFPGQSSPRGYIWKKDAKKVQPKERSFRDHAVIFSGRVKNIKAEKGKYGQIELSSGHAETLYIEFNRKYFSRQFRPGEMIKFAIAFIPNGLRAESLDSTPFVETGDDVFL